MLTLCMHGVMTLVYGDEGKQTHTGRRVPVEMLSIQQEAHVKNVLEMLSICTP